MQSLYPVDPLFSDCYDPDGWKNTACEKDLKKKKKSHSDRQQFFFTALLTISVDGSSTVSSTLMRPVTLFISLNMGMGTLDRDPSPAAATLSPETPLKDEERHRIRHQTKQTTCLLTQLVD